MALAAVLTHYAARVLLAGSAGEAQALLEHQKPDVLVADLVLHDGDGYQLVRNGIDDGSPVR